MGSKLDYLGNVFVIGLFLGWSELADTCIFVFFAVDINSSIVPKLVKLKINKEQLEVRVI